MAAFVPACRASLANDSATSQTAPISIPTPPQLVQSSQTKVVSGNYNELSLGIDKYGELTGYYHDSTGAGQFNCIFYLRGKLQGNAADITTWFPGETKQIRGKLKFVGYNEYGKLLINVKLESAHGGCGNVNPEFHRVPSM